MTTAPDYSRVYNFTNFQSANPASPLPGNEVDAELNAVKATTDAINANLQLIQRSDGALANASVGYQQLQGAILTGMNPPALWSSAGINYQPGALVFSGTVMYVCNTANTSNVLSPPTSNPAWTFLIDFSVVTFTTGQVTAADLAAGAVTSPALGPGLALSSSPAPGDNSTMIATTEFVQAMLAALTSIAASPPTADNSTKIATTAFVKSALAAFFSGLPTTLPGSAGVVWNNGGVVSIS